MAVLDSTKTVVPKAKGGKTKDQAQAAERLKRAQQASGLAEAPERSDSASRSSSCSRRVSGMLGHCAAI